MRREGRLHTVCVDPPDVAIPGRVRYRVMLAFGCFWWEERDVDAAPPKPPVCCCERHDAGMSEVPLKKHVSHRHADHHGHAVHHDQAVHHGHALESSQHGRAAVASFDMVNGALIAGLGVAVCRAEE